MRRLLLLTLMILLAGCGHKVDNTPEANSSRFFVQKALESYNSVEMMAAAQQCQRGKNVPECEQLKQPLQVIADRFQGCAGNPTASCQAVMAYEAEFKAAAQLPTSQATPYPLHPFYGSLHSGFNAVSDYRSEIAVYWINSHRTHLASLVTLLGIGLLGLALWWGIWSPWLSRRSQFMTIAASSTLIPTQIPQAIPEGHLEQKRLEMALKARQATLARKRMEGLKQAALWKLKKAEKLQRLEEQKRIQQLKSDLEGLL